MQSQFCDWGLKTSYWDVRNIFGGSHAEGEWRCSRTRTSLVWELRTYQVCACLIPVCTCPIPVPSPGLLFIPFIYQAVNVRWSYYKPFFRHINIAKSASLANCAGGRLHYLTWRSVLSLNNPQNSEMKFFEKYEVDMLKIIIIIIIGYILNNFKFPKEFSIAPHFYPICFGKCCPPFTYIHGQPKGRNSMLQNRTLYLGSLHSFSFFGVMSQSNWLIANQKKNWTWEAHHLINRKRNTRVGTDFEKSIQ